MSADDRANFAHGIGFKPDTSTADLKADLVRHQQAMDAAASTRNGGDFTGSEQTVEYPGLDADLHAGSLQNLPKSRQRPPKTHTSHTSARRHSP